MLIDHGAANPRIRLAIAAITGFAGRNKVTPPMEEDEDVVAERKRIAEERASNTSTDVIAIDRLRKVYPGGKVAVVDLSYGVAAGEVRRARRAVILLLRCG
jgi:hypothetical protein